MSYLLEPTVGGRGVVVLSHDRRLEVPDISFSELNPLVTVCDALYWQIFVRARNANKSSFVVRFSFSFCFRLSVSLRCRTAASSAGVTPRFVGCRRCVGTVSKVCEVAVLAVDASSLLEVVACWWVLESAVFAFVARSFFIPITLFGAVPFSITFSRTLGIDAGVSGFVSFPFSFSSAIPFSFTFAATPFVRVVVKRARVTTRTLASVLPLEAATFDLTVAGWKRLADTLRAAPFRDLVSGLFATLLLKNFLGH